MPIYEYQAISATSQSISGVATADNPRLLRQQLRDTGLIVQSCKEISTPSPANQKIPVRQLWPWGKRSAWADYAQELSTLLSCGLPLLQALDAVTENAGPFWKKILLQLKEEISSGRSLKQAMSGHPELFDETSLQLIEMGEQVGKLDQALEQVATFQRRTRELKNQVTSAMIYPLFVLTFGLGATLFLMTGVLPQLLESLEENLKTIPWPTRVVSAASQFLIKYGIFLIITGVTIIVIILGWINTQSGRKRWDHFLLTLPLLGNLLLKQGLSRSAMMLATLLGNGIPLLRALELTAQSSTNKYLQSVLKQAHLALMEGKDVSATWKKQRLIPRLAVEIFAVGEESGQLEHLLNKLSIDYDKSVQTETARLVSLMEPCLILLLAVLIGFVILAVILPILEAGNVVL